MPRAAAERVFAPSARQGVVTLTACERVAASTAEERVFAPSATQRVVTLTAANGIAAVTAGDRVVAGAAVEDGLDPGVAGNADGDRVVAGAPEDADGGDPRLPDRADDDAVDDRP